jgi:histidinol-phosphate aminotransferase
VTEWNIQRFVPAHVAGLAGYHAKPPVAFAPDVLKMDLNECLAPPSPRVLAALRAALDHATTLNWYPDDSCTELRAAISRYLNVPADHLLVTNGSNASMEILARAFLAANDPVLIVSPVYAVFDVQCQLQQARTDHFYFTQPFAPDFTELINYTRPTRIEMEGRASSRPSADSGHDKAWPSDSGRSAKIIYLANPNNPTGVGHARESIRSLLAQRPDTLIVLDEAYNEFYGVSCVDLIDEFPNLIILRSFSKAFSLAGMRCGYLVAQPAVLDVARRALAPWPVNGLTQIAACAALADADAMRRFVAECRRARQLIVDGLTALGFTARNGHGNFILWQVPDPAQTVAALAAKKVYVSNKDAVPQLRGHLRVTVGTVAQAEQFLNVVKSL